MQQADLFSTNDEERLHLMQGEPASEVGEVTIHDRKPRGENSSFPKNSRSSR